ncbi:MAG: adenylyl-sulfate kinase [Candidatus Omnitrophica bacterium]|nr:adenylyl-sulfate kinase [Candidatus Omnitrophota bacterium]
MVIWFIGLSRSGKTTLSKLLYQRLKPQMNNLILLDGDIVRTLFKNDVDHSVAGRRRNAERLSNLSKFLSDQGVHVIAAVLSIFPEWQKWNRENIKDYSEVYVKVSMDTLIKRDAQKLYAPALAGEMMNVVGVDIPFPEPKYSDLVLENNEPRENFDDLLDQILELPVIPK